MFDPRLADIRFGTGVSPIRPSPQSVDDILAALTGPDQMASAFQIDKFTSLTPSPLDIAQAHREMRKSRGTETFEAKQDIAAAYKKQARQRAFTFFEAAIKRSVDTEDGFRERLTQFWSDHFTTRKKSGGIGHQISAFVEETIRPNMTGHFADMLRQVALHPVMLMYLDQTNAVGPNSRIAKKRERPVLKLSENLARELLELHTVGVEADYTQVDIRQLAELLTGVNYTIWRGFRFIPGIAEPGAETVLGENYGGPYNATIDDIYAFLDDVAVHPATAEHISRKLAVHFVADNPDADMIAQMTKTFLATNGHLFSVYETMLAHPAAWAPKLEKTRQPYDFLCASFRALGITSADIGDLSERERSHLMWRSLRSMGQPWQEPLGPDGWPEDAASWITPQSMAMRIHWAMRLTQKLSKRLPPPEDLLKTLFGHQVDPELAFAAASAETQWEAIGLILVSPDFQSR